MNQEAHASTAGNDGADGAKTPIARGVEAVNGTASALQSTATNVASSAQDATASAMATAGRLPSIVARNPLGLAIGSIAAGLLVGLALPVSDIERERVGPLGEQLVDSAKNAVGSAIDQGKAVVSQAVDDALRPPPSPAKPTS